ncbi:nucleosome assembly protein 1;2 [Salvia hispanica]|uniref:nucleosome assembly protein 1;2 n=1 Tax=Salvia hispanica TaxID=49212 RepID=UPI0020091374|nr:nucleosome assembly protein 1;2 [Salvia hispanica]XP_047966442.1 nucleosome assembly protein 1;2 [Salvia hispanica]
MSNLGKKATDDDDVEQLLREAHDDVLLKLSVNSHTARGTAATAIDPDLDRRFQALKKPQKLTKNRDDSLKKPPKEADAASAVAEDDDLYSRFAALKTSIPSNSTNFTRNEVVEEQEDDDDDDEVEKLIRWATDAARLDPSPPSEDDDEDEDDSDEEDEGASRGKKGKRK